MKETYISNKKSSLHSWKVLHDEKNIQPIKKMLIKINAQQTCVSMILFYYNIHIDIGINSVGTKISSLQLNSVPKLSDLRQFCKRKITPKVIRYSYRLFITELWWF